MENLPRICMLNLPLKSSGQQPDLTPMAKDIELHYQHSSDMFRKEFSEFLIARKAACEPSIDYTGLSKQKRYYAQLQLVKGRFQFSVEQNTAVLWTWNDAFSNSPFESLDIGFEEAAILFNIAALHTILGAKETRVEADSMKVACTHFQCAAWALERFTERHYSADASGDLNAELIRTLTSLMTAQAQECIVEKSVSDGRPASITAKLTQYLAQAYEQIATQLSNHSVLSCLPQRFQKDWRRRCQVKHSYYSALVAYFAAMVEEGEQKYGKAIAWLRVAERRIAEAEKVVKELKESDTNPVILVSGGLLRVNVQFVTEAVQSKLPRLIKDNDFIYHEVVPDPDSLEPVKAACLVKGVPFDPNDPEIRGADIFQRLVPMKTLEATSVYSERKAALLRSIASEVDDKETEIEVFLTSIDLDPHSMMQPDPPVPQELYDACTQIGALEYGPERELSNHMQNLVNGSTDVESEAQQLTDLITGLKARADALLIVRADDRIKSIRNQLIALGERLQGLTSMIQVARNSNVQLREILGSHLQTFKRFSISVGELISQLPSVNPILEDDSVKRVMVEARRLFDKVSEMRRQRTDLIGQLREALHRDDVTGDLLATSNKEQSDLEEFFQKRLKKHDHLVGLLRQNLSAQENIESALIDLNAEFAPQATKLRELRAKRGNELEQLIVSGKVYADVVQKCEEGLQFYKELMRRLMDLRKEADQLTERVAGEESRPVVSLPTTTTSMVPAAVPRPNTVITTPTQPRPGPIPTLGDYMTAMRQQKSESRTAAQIPSMTSPWPTAIPTVISTTPNSRIIPSGQPLRPQPPPAMFTQSAPTHMMNQSFVTSMVGGEHSRMMAPGPPVRFLPGQPTPTQLPAQSGAVSRLEPVGQPLSRNPTQLPTQPPFGVTRPPVMPFTTAPTRPDMSRATLPGMQIPYMNYTAAGMPQASLHSNTGQPVFQGWPTQTHTGYSTPGSYAPKLSNTPQPPTQTTSAGQPVNTPASTSGFMYRGATSEFRNPMNPEPIPMNPLERPSTIPLSTVTRSPGSLTIDQSQAPRMPFQSQVNQPAGLPYSGMMQLGSVQAPPPPLHSPQQPSVGAGFSLHSTIQPRPGVIAPPPMGVQLTQFPHSSMSGIQPFYQPGVQLPQPPPPPPPQQQQSAIPSDQQPGATYSSPLNVSHTTTNFAPQTTLNVVAPSDPKPVNNTGTTSNNAVTGTLCSTNTAPLQPQVLTKADLDAQKREERLRASYGNSPVPKASTPSSECGLSIPMDTKRSKEASDTFRPISKGSTEVHNDSKVVPRFEYKASESNHLPADPLSDPLVLNPFIAATENLLTWLEHLRDPIPSDSKPGTTTTRLDKSWARLQAIAMEPFTSSSKKPTQAAALCCANKNRRQNCVPYDVNRVVLNNPKNDYINASHIDFVNCFGDWCPRYIIAQAPMQKTVIDFWQMILTQGCEVVVFLPPACASSQETPLSGLNDWSVQGEGSYGDPTNPLAIPPHLPPNKVGSRFQVSGGNPPLELRLQALKNCELTNRIVDSKASKPCGYIERILAVRNMATDQTRSLVHLTYHGAVHRSVSPSGSVTDSDVESFCAFVNHVHTYYKQQRSLLRPIAVVCEYGDGLSGCFVTSSVCLLHAERLGRLADCVDVAGRLSQQRRGVISQPTDLVSAARVVAQAAIEAAAKRDIVVGPRRHSSAFASTSRLASKAAPIMDSVPPVVDPVDSLFSDQPLQFGELLSVMDKWNLSMTTTDNKRGIDDHEGDENVEMDEIAKTKISVNENLVVTEDASVNSSLSLNTESSTHLIHDMTTDLNRLVDLSSLGKVQTSGRRRYQRQDFETGTRPSASKEEDPMNDPFSQLDPFRELVELSDSAVP